MTMIVIMLLIAFAGVTTALFYFRRSGLTSGSSVITFPFDRLFGRSTAPVETPARKYPYECVMIKPCLEGCDLVNAQRDTRYLADEAPELPLAGCDSARCRCRYGYYTDRREQGDRRFRNEKHAIARMASDGDDRRDGGRPDRRRSDDEDEPPAYFNHY